ncbi:MAG: DUF4340 domain-containing protein [Acidobacteriota bacterium]
MRGGRSFLVLLVVALGLGAYIYFVESKRDPNEGEKKAKVFTVDPAKIEEVEVHASSGAVTKLKKTGETWAMIAPTSSTVDESAVSSLVDALASMEVDKVLDENPTSLTQFGLEPARYSVSFKVAGDATTHRLTVGAKTPTGSGLYARVEGQNRLFLAPATQDDTLNRTTFDLRDKRVLVFSRDSADSVSLAAKGSPAITLAKKGTDWRLTSPIETRADFNPVDGLIGRLDQVHMLSLVSEGAEPSAAQLKTYGLDAPQLIATVGAGSSKATLAIGAKKDESGLYARDLSRPIVFTVEPALLTDLTKKADDLRVKDVFQFKSFSANSLDITHGAAAVSYAKKKPATAAADASAQDVWAQTKPATKDVNQTAMTDLINTLTSLRVDRFVDKAPASGDDLVVVAHTADGAAATEERVTLRKAGDAVYAIQSGETGAGVVPTAEFDKALTQLKTLTDAK